MQTCGDFLLAIERFYHLVMNNFLKKETVMKLIYALLISSFIYSQVSKGGTPISFKESLSPSVEMVTMESVDVQSLLEEDKENGKDVPFRFGYGFEVSYDLLSNGTWKNLSNGGINLTKRVILFATLLNEITTLNLLL